MCSQMPRLRKFQKGGHTQGLGPHTQTAWCPSWATPVCTQTVSWKECGRPKEVRCQGLLQTGGKPWHLPFLPLKLTSKLLFVLTASANALNSSSRNLGLGSWILHTPEWLLRAILESVPQTHVLLKHQPWPLPQLGDREVETGSILQR